MFKLGEKKKKKKKQIHQGYIIIVHEVSGKTHLALFIVSPILLIYKAKAPAPLQIPTHNIDRPQNSPTPTQRKLNMAAEECTATASPTPHSWWDLHPLSSWTTNTTSTSTTTSLTNANSNHSGLTVESPGGGGGSGRQLVDQPPVVPPHHQSNDLIGEHASDNHLWSQVLS